MRSCRGEVTMPRGNMSSSTELEAEALAVGAGARVYSTVREWKPLALSLLVPRFPSALGGGAHVCCLCSGRSENDDDCLEVRTRC